MPATLHLVPMSGEAPDHSDALRNVSALETVEDRAFQRGQASAQMKGQLESHERRLNAINGSIDRSTQALDALKAAFEQNIAIAQARAEDAKTAAEKQVSTRTFLLGLVGAVAAIGTLLAATGHA
jgi:HKD family nuclease